MTNRNYRQVNGFLYCAEADNADGHYRGTIDFMRVEDYKKTFVPSVRYTLNGPFDTLDAAMTAAQTEGFRRANEGDVEFD